MKRTEYASDAIKRLPYLLDFPQVGQLPPSNHLNAHRLPITFSLPDVCEPKRGVVRGVITQFQAVEDSRSTEQGVGQKSGPRVRTGTRGIPSGYDLTTRGVRH